MLDCTDIEEALYRLDLKIKGNCTRLSTKDIQLMIDIMIALNKCSEGSGEGDIKNAVLYTEQFKTEAEQLIARNNIGAVDIEEVRQFIIDNSEYLAEQLGFELLSNKQNSLTPDGTGTKYPTVDAVIQGIEDATESIEDYVQNIIITELQPIYVHFNNKQSVFVEHMLNKYPNVKVMIGDEEVLPHEINHNPDMNSLTVYFTEVTSGLIVIQ